MLKYKTGSETVLVWQFVDRIFIQALLYIIKPLFPHIIAPQVFHLQGPTGVKKAIDYLQKGLTQNDYRYYYYYFRIDIKSYYASICHETLLTQLTSLFKDKRLMHYLKSIITIGHRSDGQVILPTQGTALRSSLSPTFGAIYLSPLDKAFLNKPGLLYLRYMDDIILLTQSKKQFVQTKKKLKTILRLLKLSYSPKKTKMGVIRDTFHFLGVEFSLSKQTETQIPFKQTQVRLHSRTCARSLLKIQLKNASGVLPQEVQSYLKRWSAWWSRTSSTYYSECLKTWVSYSKKRAPPLRWLGSGLLSLR